MASITGYVRRIDLEPKQDFLDFRTYAHVFLVDPNNQVEVDVYTESPRFEAGFLAAFLPEKSTSPRPLVEVEYEIANLGNKVTRLVLDDQNVKP